MLQVTLKTSNCIGNKPEAIHFHYYLWI